MNFLQVSLTSKCNRRCERCPMKEWLDTDHPQYHLDNSVLIPFLEKNVDPADWLVELTGGEPALYEGIDELQQWLADCGYTVHIRTNGSIALRKYPPRQKIIAAFHDYGHPPKVFDVLLIVDKLDSERKVKWCEINRIPYRLIGYGKENPDMATHGFDRISFIEPSCHSLECPCGMVTIELEDGVDKSRMEYTGLHSMKCCQHCKAAIDAWRFLQ